MMQDGFAKLYILTLGVLEAYRNQGLGTNYYSLLSSKCCNAMRDMSHAKDMPCFSGSELLRRSMLACRSDEVIKLAELHVHIINTGAIKFYERHGFSQVKVISGYYSKLLPGDAVLLQMNIDMRTESTEIA